MEVEYLKDRAAICISFEPAEIPEATELLRAALAEAKEKKMHLPVLDEKFFERLLSSKEKVGLVFNFGHLEVGMYYLEKVFVELGNSGRNIESLGATLDRVWAEVAPYCVMDSTFH